MPQVHRVIANLKRLLLGTFHGVSGRYLQEYIDEFVFRFNRRLWKNNSRNACWRRLSPTSRCNSG